MSYNPKPLRDRILKSIYDAKNQSTSRLEARAIAGILNEDTKLIHDTLNDLASEGVLTTPAKAIFEMVNGENTHMYYFSLTHLGINEIESKTKKPTTVTNIKAKNYFDNKGSTINKQAGTINEAPAPKEEKKGTPHWLQIVYWVVGIIVAGTILYQFVIKEWVTAAP